MSIKFTVDAKFKTTLDKLQIAMKEVAQLPIDTHKYFVSITPIDTGNARRSTSLRGKTIEANYPYAKRLDEGWSRQAPQGMVKPTERFVEKRVKEINQKIGR